MSKFIYKYCALTPTAYKYCALTPTALCCALTPTALLFIIGLFFDFILGAPIIAIISLFGSCLSYLLYYFSKKKEKDKPKKLLMFLLVIVWIVEIPTMISLQIKNKRNVENKFQNIIREVENYCHVKKKYPEKLDKIFKDKTNYEYYVSFVPDFFFNEKSNYEYKENENVVSLSYAGWYIERNIHYFKTEGCNVGSDASMSKRKP